MYFGEYLVEVGAATELEVLAALKAQHRREPFLPMLTVELGLLSASQAFAVLKVASAQGNSFLEAARAQRFLTADDLSKLAAAHHAAVPPVGQILVEMDVLTTEGLEEHLAAHADLETSRK